MLRDRQFVQQSVSWRDSVSWVAISAAVCLFVAGVLAIGGYFADDPLLLRLAGVEALVGVGWAILSMRDDS